MQRLNPGVSQVISPHGKHQDRRAVDHKETEEGKPQ